MDNKYITIKIRRNLVDELRQQKQKSGVPVQWAIEKAVKVYLAETREAERR
jgi:hypothetical protein